MRRYNNNWGYPPYVPVSEKKEHNAKLAQKLMTKNNDLKPIILTGTKIAKTFWGKAWCDNVESYLDYENRLPRGRSYLRHGAVLDLQISTGFVTALVAGSSNKPYAIKIEITPLSKSRWEMLKKKCVGKISSLLALAQGKLPPEILTEFCKRESGLFPSPEEIEMHCSCPDWAGLCKHLAAVLYGIGARLDQTPEIFFTLRGIDRNELIGTDMIDSLTAGVTSEIAPENLSNIFGMEFDSLDAVIPTPPQPAKKPSVAKVAAKPAEEKILTRSQIARIRRKLGITQGEFAKQLGVSVATISKYENGKTSPNMKTSHLIRALQNHKK